MTHILGVHAWWQVHFAEHLELDAPYWLVKDRSVQCFVGAGYWVYATIAIFTMLQKRSKYTQPL